MPIKRYWFQFLVFLSAAVLVLIAAFAAEHACRLVWLPGEGGFALRQGLWRAMAHLFGQGDINSRYCAGGALAGRLNALVPWLGLGLIGLGLAQLLYEALRNTGWRRWMARRGGHTVILGETDELARLVAGEPSRRRVLLVGSPQSAATLPRRFWRNVTAPPGVTTDSLGLARASRVYAVSRSDIRNRDLALAARQGQARDIVIRIESAALRAAYAHAGTNALEDLSVLQAMMRDGAAAGDPAAMLARGQFPAHVVLCGGGSGLDELAAHLAGFGYGLDVAPPRFTILQTDGRLSPVIERLMRRHDIVTLVHDRLDGADAQGLEAALLSSLASDVPPAAIHCIDDREGSAAASAMLAQAAAAAVAARGTRIIAYGEQPASTPSAARPGIHWIAPDDLADAISRKSVRDKVARAVHEHYLALQRRTRGADFGSMAAERPWAELSMAYRDDNRAVADHIDHMLAVTGYRRGPPGPDAPAFSADDIERMARMAHGRWMAARALKGWRYGKERDDRQMLHPSMVPYEALSEPEKEKDRDQVRAIPHILAAADEALQRRHAEAGA